MKLATLAILSLLLTVSCQNRESANKTGGPGSGETMNSGNTGGGSSPSGGSTGTP